MVDLNCEGYATIKSFPSSSPSRHCLIHEFGDLDMPLAVAQLGHVQEDPQELQWTLSSPVELQWDLKSALVRMAGMDIYSENGIFYACPYGTKCVGRLVTKSMSKICIFWCLIVGDCDYAEI